MDFFDRFQITALAFFYVMFIGRMLQLRRRGTNPLVLGSGEKGWRGIVEALFGLGLVIWTLGIIVSALTLRLRFLPDVLFIEWFDLIAADILGSAVIGVGLIIFAASLISFGNSWRVGIDKKRPGALVTSGIFSMTRNPIFLFLDLYFLGTWLIFPNLFFGISAMAVIAGIHWQILQEEEFLGRQYGTAYQKYARRVRRYF